jgi:hypothetical protein
MRLSFSLASALAAGLWGAALQTPGAAQTNGAPMCRAVSQTSDERTSWFDADRDFIRDTAVQSAGALVKRFAGTYTLLVVTSEGSLEKRIAEYALKLEPPDPTQSDQIRQIPAVTAGRLLVPLMATINYRRGAIGRRKTADRPWPDIAGSTRFDYWPDRGHLGFNVGLGLDSGTLFDITEVNADGSFAGRWTDGGFTVVQLDTPVGPLLEKEQGYFCALPKRG